VDCGQFTGTAEAQRTQSKPNEDALTSKKYRNTFDVKVKYYRLKAVALGTKGPRILVVKSITHVMLSFTREPLTPCTLVAKKSN
jgi:hypothetical protein